MLALSKKITSIWRNVRENRRLRTMEKAGAPSSRRLKTQWVGFGVPASFDAPTPYHVNVNPGFSGLGVHRLGPRSPRAQYVATIMKQERGSNLHEVGHAYQSIVHDRRGFKLYPFSLLAHFEENTIRCLGFGFDPKASLSFQSPTKPSEELLKKNSDIGLDAYVIASHFKSPTRFFRALMRLYRDPSMRGHLEVLNEKGFNDRRDIDKRMNFKQWSKREQKAISAFYAFFENYLKKHPQK